MSHASTRLMLALALAAATTVGCGDDDRPPTDSGTPPADTGGGGDSGGGMCDLSAFGPQTGMGCADPADQMAAAASNFGPMMDESLADIAGRVGRDCALAGMTGEALTNCVRDALVMESGMGVSAGCAACYGVSVTCSASNCLAPCLGTDMAACDACRCGMNMMNCNCVEAFTGCSGLPSSSCM